MRRSYLIRVDWQHFDVCVGCALQIHRPKVQSAPEQIKVQTKSQIFFFEQKNGKLKTIHLMRKIDLAQKLLTQHDRHSRKRRRLNCRSSNPKIKLTTGFSEVSIISALSNNTPMFVIASRSNSTICRLMRMFSMFEKNRRCRTNTPASAVKKLIY